MAGNANFSEVNTKIDMCSAIYTWNLKDFNMICAEPEDSNLFNNSTNSNINHSSNLFVNSYITNGLSSSLTSHWPFDAVPLRCLLDTDYIQSSVFSIGVADWASTWVVYLRKENAMSDKLYIFLYMESGPRDILIKYRFSILDRHGQPNYLTNRHCLRYMSPTESVGSDWHVSISHLYAARDELIIENTLKIQTEVEIIFDVYHFNANDECIVEELVNTPPPHRLQNPDYKMLWETKKYADVYIKNGDILIPAHKSIISFGSEFIRHLIDSQPEFESDEKGNFGPSGDSNGNKIASSYQILTIETVVPIVLNFILEYIYTGEISEMDWNNFDLICDLISSAQIFKIQSLFFYSFNRLQALKMNLASISQLMVLIHLFQVPETIKINIYRYCFSKLPDLKIQPDYKRMCEQYPGAFVPLLSMI